MKFTEHRLENGEPAFTIRRTVEQFDDGTADYPGVLRLAQELLTRLRRGEEHVMIDRPTLPRAGISLGPPAWLAEEMGEAVEAPGRLFCVSEPGRDPVVANFLQPDSPPADRDVRAVGTMLGLSTLGVKGALAWTEEDIQARSLRLLNQRPVVLSVVMPSYAVSHDIMVYAAELSSWFAAALLTER